MEDDQGAVSRKWYFQILHWALTGRDDRFKATSKNVIPSMLKSKSIEEDIP